MAGLNHYKPLRLIANDAEDLSILSASLQDAVAKVGDFSFLPEERRFAFVANRFLWEVAGKRSLGLFGRVRSGIHFDDVLSVKHYHLRTDAKEAVVDLLAIGFEQGEDGTGAVMLNFAGGGAIRLDVESINAQMSDISAPWRTRLKPKHEE